MASTSFFKKILLPKEEKFFPLFIDLADLVTESAGILSKIVESSEPSLQIDLFRQIKELEKRADDIAHGVFDALDTTFITPFDREDIHQLVSKMDDILDYVNACSQQIKLYKPKKLLPQFKEMVAVIIRGCEQLRIATKELHNLKKPKKISDACVKINELENVADDIYHHLLSELFETEKNAIELIKNKEILETLEMATDSIEDVSDILKTIIIKSA
jgi:predicted phosphate transport protein (TIGR00153 family)